MYYDSRAHCMLGRDEGMYDDAAAGRCQIFSLFLDKPQPLSDFLLIQVPYPAYRYRYLPRYGTAVLVDWNRRTANGKRFISKTKNYSYDKTVPHAPQYFIVSFCLSGRSGAGTLRLQHLP